MRTEFIETALPGVLIVEPAVYRDSRGFFLEMWQQTRYVDGGIDAVFVQDNHSRSSYGVLRGLHYQLRHPQGKLIYVVSGEIFDVAVDIRRGSPTFGKWVGVVLSGENKRQLYVPEGFAHGFCVMSETVDVMYKCTDYYSPKDECGVKWDDPSLGIKWPVDSPVLSGKDELNPLLSDIPSERLPHY
ncbi:MAG: dTDP-4-dehydrorhamnose 3,5-epimerase [Nitrospirae bacterium]|nr:dTDP-4-dehydrorhamnose 3,5-epimerase [Nitrospirota bacterium]